MLRYVIAIFSDCKRFNLFAEKAYFIVSCFHDTDWNVLISCKLEIVQFHVHNNYIQKIYY